jgi:hypothetical protein
MGFSVVQPEVRFGQNDVPSNILLNIILLNIRRTILTILT